MTLIKGVLFGAVLSWIVSLVIGSTGTSGGYLNIHAMPVHTIEVYWSWPLFIATTFIATAIMSMMK